MPIKDNRLILDGYTLTIEELMQAGHDLSMQVGSQGRQLAQNPGMPKDGGYLGQ